MVQTCANCNQHIEHRCKHGRSDFCIMKATVLGSSATVHICNSSSALMRFSNSLHRGDVGGSYSICIPTAWLLARWTAQNFFPVQMIQTSCNISSATSFYFFASSTHLGYGLQLLHLQTRLRPPALASETVWQAWLRASRKASVMAFRQMLQPME